MLRFYISLQVDDEFGVPVVNPWVSTQTPYNPNGILSINGSFAHVDPKIFDKKDFFKPVQSVINNGVNINDLSVSDIEELVSVFGKYEVDSNTMNFDLNNFYDLDRIFI